MTKTTMALAVSALFTLACNSAFENSSGSGGGSGVCSAYDDETSQATVTIRLRNDSGVPMYIPAGCGPVMPIVEPSNGPDGTTYRYSTSCLSTCEDLREAEPFACTAEDCAPSLQRIEPGAIFDMPWDGTGLRPTNMPAACFFEPSSNLQCQQIVAAPAQSYRVEIRAYSACSGQCMCDVDGRCFGEPGGVEGFHAPVTFEHPNQDVVEVLFEVCAFGCAADTTEP